MLPPLSILDVIPVGVGSAPSRAIHDSMALVRHAEELGYTRYWFAEHHNMPSIASSSPEVLIAHAASITSKIRLGAGGIMVPNHAPLHIAEVFRTLEALHPGRIDLGLGRAPGTDPVTALALGRTGADDEVDGKLAELFAFAGNSFPKGHAFADIRAVPDDIAFPRMWMLGSTATGASIAAKLGLGFAFAGHFNMAEAREATTYYHANFRPTPQLEKPELILAVSVICGEDDTHAKWLAGPYRVGVARMLTGKPGPLPSFDEAAGYAFAPQERAALLRFEHGAVIGGPETVAQGLDRLARAHKASELMISTLVPDAKERATSFTRVAKVKG